MLFPVESPESWSEKYKIEIARGTCSKCKSPIIANIPFAQGTVRGFVSEDHGCGKQYCLIVYRCYWSGLEDILRPK